MLGEEEKMLDQLTYETSYDLEGESFLLSLAQHSKAKQLMLMQIDFLFDRQTKTFFLLLLSCFCNLFASTIVSSVCR